MSAMRPRSALRVTAPTSSQEYQEELSRSEAKSVRSSARACVTVPRSEGSAAKSAQLKPHTTLTVHPRNTPRSEEHTSELQSRLHLVCRLLLEKKKHNQL